MKVVSSNLRKNKNRKRYAGNIYEVVEDAINDGSKIEITYENSSGEFTDRVISPKRYDSYRNVVSYCHLRHENRTFRVDRMLTAFRV
ncbi:MAG: helix-turn-helix transcriptional regulator [Oligoflexales bacterium]